MRLNEMSPESLKRSLSRSGVNLQTGRFVSKIQTRLSHVTNDLMTLYGDTELQPENRVDFVVTLESAGGLRRWIRPKAHFKLFGIEPFTPLPASQATPLLEWGLNWCVSNHFHRALIIHAAVVEKYGKAVIMPGQPGSGKSTLCAALVLKHGFRLLSDELTLISLDNANVIPNPRPISLKNQSIQVIRDLVPEVEATPVVKDTVKGAVSLFRAPQSSVEKLHTTASPGMVLFPKYDSSISDYSLSEVPKGRALVELANQSFNYPVLGKAGFEALARHLPAAQCYDFRYSGDLAMASQMIDELLCDAK